MSQPAQRHDPHHGGCFVVTADGLELGGFSEVRGLEAEIVTQELQEGGLNDRIHALAGPVRYPSKLVLVQGVSGNDVLWRWFRLTAHGQVFRFNVTVQLLDAAGAVVDSWIFREAYPVKWSGPRLQALDARVAVETVEFCHRGILA